MFFTKDKSSYKVYEDKEQTKEVATLAVTKLKTLVEFETPTSAIASKFGIDETIVDAILNDVKLRAESITKVDKTHELDEVDLAQDEVNRFRNLLNEVTDEQIDKLNRKSLINLLKSFSQAEKTLREEGVKVGGLLIMDYLHQYPVDQKTGIQQKDKTINPQKRINRALSGWLESGILKRLQNSTRPDNVYGTRTPLFGLPETVEVHESTIGLSYKTKIAPARQKAGVMVDTPLDAHKLSDF